MKFNELPQSWKTVVITLRTLAITLLIALIANIWMNLGSLLRVMVG